MKKEIWMQTRPTRFWRRSFLNVKKLSFRDFYGIGADGRVKTFSRGGSDITGPIVAKSMSCKFI